MVVGFLLKLREKYNVSTAATCFINEKLGLFIDQDQMTLDVDSPASRACQKFKCDKALSKYIKTKKYSVESKETQVGFDAATEKAETIQYIPTLETLTISLKKEMFAYHIDHNDIFKNNNETSKCFRNGRAFQENAQLSSNTVELICHDDFNVVNPLRNKTVKYKASAFYFILGKLPCTSRSKLSDFNLILSSAQIVSKYGFKNFFSLLDGIRELQKTER